MEAKSYYVKRVKQDGTEAFVGSIRSPHQAEKEAQAWRNAGQEAEVLPNTPTIREQVRAWQKQVRARHATPRWR